MAALAHSGDAGPTPAAAPAPKGRDRRAPAAEPAGDGDVGLPDPTVAAAMADAGAGSRPDDPAPETARRPSGAADGVELHVSVPVPAGADPAASAAPAEAATPASGPAPATPAAVADQIVSAVVPLHGRGDGRHEVTLELRPESLGAIRVELSVEHQTVHLTLHAVEPATAALLDRALPDLRSALADAGLHAGQVGVGAGDGGTGQRRNADDGPPSRAGHRARRTPVTAASSVAAASPPATAHAAGRLDVLL